MVPGAQVTSVDAIAAFRASLLVYLSKAKPALEQVSAEVQRTRSWVQTTQRQHWEHELKMRRRKLEEAQGELFNARISQFQQSTQLQNMAVQKAQRAVNEAEGKLAMLKKWDRELESRVDPLIKQIEQFHGYLCTEFAHGAVQLDQIVKILDAYLDTAALGHAAPASPDPAPAPAAASEKGPPA